MDFALQSYLKGRPIGLISIDANFRLWPNRPRESRAPDLSFILKERLPKELSRFLPMAPELLPGFELQVSGIFAGLETKAAP